MTVSADPRAEARRLASEDPAEKIRAQASAAHERVRKDTSLTSKAKVQRHARIERDARHSMAELEQRTGAEASSRLTAARRKAFGIEDLITGDGTTVRADHRAALDRVEALSSAEEGARMLQRAQDLGDKVLERAIGLAAFTKSRQIGGGDWNGVLSAYAEAGPERSEAIETLMAPTPTGGGAALFRYVLPTPAELHSKINRSKASDAELEQLAAGEDVSGFGS
jgi:hypothetical protein